jgi:hypothetical protein
MTKNKSGQLTNINNTQTSSVVNNIVTTGKKTSKKKSRIENLNQSLNEQITDIFPNDKSEYLLFNK